MMKPTVILPLLALLAAACSGNDGDPQNRIAQTDIVTVADAGAPARFILDGLDDSGAVTLTFAGVSVDKELEGGRALLRYYPAADGAEARALGVAPINCGAVRDAAMDTTGWDADPVEMISMWRTGDWLNMRMRVSWSADPRLFHLVVDESTLTSACPVMYLVHNLRGASPSYLTETYASWDISRVIDLSTCEAFQVRVNDLSTLSTVTTMTNNRNQNTNKQ